MPSGAPVFGKTKVGTYRPSVFSEFTTCKVQHGPRKVNMSQRPSPDECQLAVTLLSLLHGEPDRGNPNVAAGTQPIEGTVLDSLVRTILSQNTTDKLSHAAFLQLKACFPTWRSVLDAAPGAVEEAIKRGGLAEIKTRNIKGILAKVLVDYAAECVGGEPTMEFYRLMPTDRIKQELRHAC
jgi:endonuclease-3